MPAVFLLSGALAALIIAGSATYYASGITRAESWLIAAIGAAGIALVRRRRRRGQEELTPTEIKEPAFDLLAFLFLVCEGVLFWLLARGRTDNLLPSPWQAVGPEFFLLFAFSTILLFVFARHSPKSGAAVFLSSVHLFLMLSVSVIIYRLGFGFDAFVHRATEEWIRARGLVLPKTPYYIGQYSFVTLVSHLTGLSIFWIDALLVPLLSALLLPAAISRAMRGMMSPVAVFLIPFLPFITLSLTTPYNLALLLSILAVLTAAYCLREEKLPVAPALLSIAALATHPLLGAPLAVWVAVAWMVTRINRPHLKRIFLVFGVIIMTITPTALFAIHLAINEQSLPSFANPFARPGDFLSLFARPYWYAQNSPWRFELLYFWKSLIPVVFTGLAALGLKTLWKEKNRRVELLLFPSGAMALLAGAWIVRVWAVFPGIVAYEQGDYPMRLVRASAIFLLPLAMSGLLSIFSFFNLEYTNLSSVAHRRLSLTAYRSLPILAAILLTLSLYLSYPQRNAKARFPGFNVTRSDFKAVEWIHSQDVKCQLSDVKCEINYIVLANQLVSAAALTNYSFAKYFDTLSGPLFYYSLPTGGPLYRDYGRMLYQGQKREYMEHAMGLAGVKTAYFVVNRYWANADKIINGAKKTADSWQEIDDGAVWIFVYKQ